MQIPPTSYEGLIQRSTDVATASQSKVEGTMMVPCSYWMNSSLCIKSTLIVPSNVLLTCSSHSSIA